MDTIKTGFEDMSQDKAIQKLKRQLRYRAKKPAQKHSVFCSGGPYHGQELIMTNTDTLNFTVNGMTGCYVRLRDDIQNSRIWGALSNDVARWVSSV